MLHTLTVQDFVIVDRLELSFGPGFTTLTGETGAGKSILIDALSLVLGDRGDAGAVREGCERAELAAEFEVAKGAPAAAWLAENGLEGDPGSCLLRRTIDASGRSRGFINGKAVTLQQLREVGERLVDIHGQHAHQSLLRADAQRELLDDFAGLRDLGVRVAGAWREWLVLREQREEWEKDAARLGAERDDLEWKLKELAALAFSVEEWQQLQADHRRLAHAAALAEGAGFALETLSEGEAACLAQLDAVVARLAGLRDYDPGLKELLEVLEPAQVQVQEAVYALRRYQERMELDPARLQEMESRLAAIHGLARKHRVTPDELPRLNAQWSARLAQVQAATDAQELARREAAAREAYFAAAGELSRRRQQAAADLAGKVTAAMQTLAMAGGRFSIEFLPLSEGNSHGLEHVEFQVSAHEGLPLRPLSRVASGGELSRLSLAVQTVTSRVAQVPTLIFDEVDAGIGGKVAEIVGRMMKKLGAERQVLCVTHLPQVAAAADQQWRVSKQTADGKVLSRVALLEKSARVEEIARMLGGVKITETTRKHAAEMLGL